MADDSKGLLASIGQASSTLLEIAYTRLELLSSDLEEDRLHIVSIFFLLMLATFCLVVGVVIAITLVVVMLWQSHRLLALALVAGFFILAGVAIAAFAMYKHKQKPRLFSASLAELHQDKAKFGITGANKAADHPPHDNTSSQS